MRTLVMSYLIYRSDQRGLRFGSVANTLHGAFRTPPILWGLLWLNCYADLKPLDWNKGIKSILIKWNEAWIIFPQRTSTDTRESSRFRSSWEWLTSIDIGTLCWLRWGDYQTNLSILTSKHQIFWRLFGKHLIRRGPELFLPCYLLNGPPVPALWICSLT